MPGLNSAALTVETVIAAPPEIVRATLLDFDKLPRWRNKQNMITAIIVNRAGDGTVMSGIEALPGDIAKITSVQAGQVEAEIFVNTATQFGYKGVTFAFTAHHWWEFLPSTRDAEKTVLKHCETWDGGASFMFWSYSPLRLYLAGLFAGFNEDLKAAVEG